VVFWRLKQTFHDNGAIQITTIWLQKSTRTSFQCRSSHIRRIFHEGHSPFCGIRYRFVTLDVFNPYSLSVCLRILHACHVDRNRHVIHNQDSETISLAHTQVDTKTIVFLLYLFCNDSPVNIKRVQYL
jgi:hypothetical protein